MKVDKKLFLQLLEFTTLNSYNTVILWWQNRPEKTSPDFSSEFV